MLTGGTMNSSQAALANKANTGATASPILNTYEQLDRIALLGGIGTGTVSLGGW